jgi:TonB family protein
MMAIYLVLVRLMIFEFRTLAVSIVCFSLTFGLNATTVPTKKSDSEMSRALIGTWELESAEKSPAVRKFFVSVNADGTFKLITILDFLSFQGRKEDQGKWWIKDGRLLTQTAVSSAPQLRYGPKVQDKISFQGNMVILETKHGEQQMHKAPIPSQLPPMLRPHWIDKLTVEKPTLDYPIEARRLYLEGEGFFKLSINEKTGTVASVQILKSTGHKILDDAAIRGLKNWRTKPGTMRLLGMPVRFTLTRNAHPERPIDSPERPIDSLIPRQSLPVSPEVDR